MKRRASLPLISFFSAQLAFAVWSLGFVPPAAAQQKPATQNAPAATATPEGGLNGRIERLEQRILDMQSVIATLQSFVKGGAAATAPGSSPLAVAPAPGSVTGGAPSEISIRVLALETQIRALTGQIEQVSEKLSQMDARTGAPVPPLQPGRQLGDVPNLAPQPPQASSGGAQFGTPARAAPQFGTTTTAPAPANPFEQAMRAPPQGPAAPQAPRQPAALPPPLGQPAAGSGARGVYDASYQNFLRNDLRAAEQGFRSFVNTYPDDPLASNAYYWLGRTHFERKNFEPAAKAFLAGYKKDKKSAIAPDALLHLGMSLTQMGENGAACSTLKAISKQFPDAPGKLRSDTATAMKRARC